MSNVQDLLQEIKTCAESGLMGETWGIADRLANMREALEQIVKLCNATPDNNHVITILKAVAYGEVCSDDRGSECPFPDCSGDENFSPDRIEEINHGPECPTTLARAILREQGTPLKLYKITYDRITRHLPPYPIEVTRLGYTEDEIKQQFEKPVFHYEKWENIQVTCIKDM